MRSKFATGTLSICHEPRFGTKKPQSLSIDSWLTRFLPKSIPVIKNNLKFSSHLYSTIIKSWCALIGRTSMTYKTVTNVTGYTLCTLKVWSASVKSSRLTKKLGFSMSSKCSNLFSTKLRSVLSKALLMLCGTQCSMISINKSSYSKKATIW